MFKLLITCPFCGRKYTLLVPKNGYNAWRKGKAIQNAMPEVSTEVRESLISGLCSSCQNDVFSEPEEEDDDIEDADACMRKSLEMTGMWW